ncbi:hypothetical protein BDW67DRAFT_150791 [Aspergillus spinulosporus]
MHTFGVPVWPVCVQHSGYSSQSREHGMSLRLFRLQSQSNPTIAFVPNMFETGVTILTALVDLLLYGIFDLLLQLAGYVGNRADSFKGV